MVMEAVIGPRPPDVHPAVERLVALPRYPVCPGAALAAELLRRRLSVRVGSRCEGTLGARRGGGSGGDEPFERPQSRRAPAMAKQRFETQPAELFALPLHKDRWAAVRGSHPEHSAPLEQLLLGVEAPPAVAHAESLLGLCQGAHLGPQGRIQLRRSGGGDLECVHLITNG